MFNSTTSAPRLSGLDRDGWRRLIAVFSFIFLETAILFTTAGRLDWLNGWLYTGVRLGTLLTFGIWVARINPELINERGRQRPEEAHPWDKWIGAVYALMLLVAPAVAGLDAARFGWSTMEPAWSIVGLIVLIPAMLLPYWAMMVNPFLVTTARLQESRGQFTVTSGPYRYVRHPMYTGVVLMALAAPLVLGSWWMLVPGVISTVAIVVRTLLEDRMLLGGLPGYAAYARRTRYRLLPGIW